jgi:hypothetical protein
MRSKKMNQAYPGSLNKEALHKILYALMMTMIRKQKRQRQNRPAEN